jgi:PAS domain S-box-containing protein
VPGAGTAHDDELVMLDGALRIVEVNDRAALAAGMSRSALVGMSVFDAAGIARGERFASAVRRAHEARSHERVELVRDGTGAVVEVRLFPTGDGLTMVVSDVTEQRRAERALRDSEERYRALVESQAEMLCRFRTDGTILFVNGAYARARGMTAERMIGQNFWEFVAEGDREGVRAMLMSLTPEAPEIQIENRFETAEGVRWTMWTNRALRFDASGVVVEAQSMGIEITARRTAEEALRRSESRWRMLVELSDATRAHTDPRKIVRTAMRVLREILGADRCVWAEVAPDEDHFTFEGGDSRADLPELTGRYAVSAFGEAAAERLKAGAAFVCDDSHELPRGADREAYRATGIRALIAAPMHRRGCLVAGLGVHMLSPRRWTEHEVELVQAVAERCWESVERARAEEALRESDRRLGQITRGLDAVFYVTEFPGPNVTYVSSGTQRLWGIDPRTVCDDPGSWPRRIHPDDAPGVAGAFEAFVRGEGVFDEEYRIRLDDGSERWVRDRATIADRTPDGGVRRVTGIAEDITERRRIQMALRESDHRYHVLFDSIDQGFCVAEMIFDADGNPVDYKIIEGNPAFTTLTGLRPSPDRTVVESLPGLERWWVETYGRVALTGEPARFENHAAPMGKWFDVYAFRFGDASRGQVAIFFKDVTERKRVEAELAMHRAHLEKLVEERTAELEESHRRLRMSERMAALGTLSAGLGHDMGNILMPIRVRLDTLASLDLSEAAMDEVRGIRDLAEYLRRLAVGLRQLAVSPVPGAQSECTPLGEWWSEAEGVLRNALPRGVLLRAEIAHADACVRMSRAAMTQAMFNLVQNAGDATMAVGGGSVTVWAGREGEMVVLRVADRGVGMSEEVQRRCMEPFFTTKTRGISTGLGLALVHGLVQEAQGAVELDSEPGGGTTFTLRLPLSETDAAAPAQRTAVVRIGDARTRALVVAELARLGVDALEGAATECESGGVVVVDEAGAQAEDRGASRVIVIERGAALQRVRSTLREAMGVEPHGE